MSSPPEPPSSFSSDNVILTYLQTLAVTKPGLPCGLPVCVIPSHTINDSESLVQLAADIGPHIAMLQVQADVINDWSNGTIDQLTWIAKKHGFLLWEGSHILNSTVDFVGKARESPELRDTVRNMIQKKYTRGVVKPATWAGLSTAYAAGVTCLGEDKVDILIESLKDAAYETVATTMKSIQTEISVEHDGIQALSGRATPEEEEEEQELAMSQQQVDAWQDFFANNLGISPRKSSIELTQTITQHTETSSPMTPDNLKAFAQQPLILPNDDIPAPPLLARGVVLCLPGTTESSFTAEYRRAVIQAARDNGDFVIGFLSPESFYMNGQGDAIFDVDEGGDDRNLNEESNPQTLALFSYLSWYLGEDAPQVFNGEEGDSDASLDSKSAQYAAKLEFIIAKAMEVRENHRRSEQSGRRRAANVMDIPIIIMP